MNKDKSVNVLNYTVQQLSTFFTTYEISYFQLTYMHSSQKQKPNTHSSLLPSILDILYEE